MFLMDQPKRREYFGKKTLNGVGAKWLARARSAAFDNPLRIIAIQNVLDFLPQRVEVTLRRLPDELFVDDVVAMGEDVAKGDQLDQFRDFGGDIRCVFTGLVEGFPDNEEFTLNGCLKDTIAQKLLFGDSFQKCLHIIGGL